jgi:hypothetical protein
VGSYFSFETNISEPFVLGCSQIIAREDLSDRN